MNCSRGPKARNKPAQGNALGILVRVHQALKGRDNESGPMVRDGRVVAPLWGFARYTMRTQADARSSLWPGLAYFGPLALLTSCIIDGTGLFRAFGPPDGLYHR